MMGALETRHGRLLTASPWHPPLPIVFDGPGALVGWAGQAGWVGGGNPNTGSWASSWGLPQGMTRDRGSLSAASMSLA